MSKNNCLVLEISFPGINASRLSSCAVGAPSPTTFLDHHSCRLPLLLCLFERAPVEGPCAEILVWDWVSWHGQKKDHSLKWKGVNWSVTVWLPQRQKKCEPPPFPPVLILHKTYPIFKIDWRRLSKTRDGPIESCLGSEVHTHWHESDSLADEWLWPGMLDVHARFGHCHGEKVTANMNTEDFSPRSRSSAVYTLFSHPVTKSDPEIGRMTSRATRSKLRLPHVNQLWPPGTLSHKAILDWRRSQPAKIRDKT